MRRPAPGLPRAVAHPARPAARRLPALSGEAQ